MEKVQLKNICRPKQWKTLTGKNLVPDGKYPVYGANGIIGYYNDYNHENETLMIGCRGTCGALNISQPFSYINGNAMALDDLVDDIDIRYLYYALMGRGFQDVISGAVQPQIIRADLEKMEVWIGNKKEQKEIVDVFSKLDTVLSHRKREIQYLDDLIKARFVELFGNPVLNDKGWVQKSLGEITTKIGSGATPKGGKEAYQEDGITLIRSMNVHNGQFEYKDLAHISDEQAAKLDNVTIEVNDVLLNITGASVARSCVVPVKVLPARVNQHVCIIRCKDCIIPEFLNKLLIDDNYQDLLWGIAGSGATREAITKQQVEGLQIIMPPIELQREFMVFCKQVDKSKVAVQAALDKAQLLFNSLMQEYFG